MDYSKIYKFFAPLIAKLYRLEVVGDENIPVDGGVIVASNHTAMMDVLILSVAMKGRPVRFMAKKELFKIPLVSPLIRSFGAFPVDRGTADVSSLKKAMSLVEEGEVFGIFPQGTRCGGLDPRTTEIKPGVGLVAYRTKACVLPVMIESDRMKTKMFQKNRVIIGKPLFYDDLGFTGGGKQEYEAAAKTIFSHVCELKYGRELPTGEKPALGEGKNV